MRQRGHVRYRIFGAWLSAMVVVCAFFLAPECAFACSCAFPASASPQEITQQELSRSDAVFAGEAVDIDKPQPVTSSIAPMKVTFQVSETWKGAERETLDVQTAVSDASCGYPFDEGESYLVFASKGIFCEEGELEVGLCGSTKPLSGAETELAALGPGAASSVSPTAGERLPDTSGGLLGFSGPAWALLLVSGAAFASAAAAIRSAVRR